ncbi:hypothetical protein FQZ97_720320 [compost metagenome]
MPGKGRWQLRAAPDDADRHGEEGIAFGRGIHHGGETPARLQCVTDAGEGALLVGEVDQADARHRGVEGGAGQQVVALTIELTGFHVRQAGLLCRLPRMAKDRRRDVGGQHMAARAHATRGDQGLFARAGRHVEHARAGANGRHVQHGLGRGAEPAGQQGAPSVPGFSGVLPLRARGLAKLLGVEDGRGSGGGNEGFGHGSAPWDLTGATCTVGLQVKPHAGRSQVQNLE